MKKRSIIVGSVLALALCLLLLAFSLAPVKQGAGALGVVKQGVGMLTLVALINGVFAVEKWDERRERDAAIARSNRLQELAKRAKDKSLSPKERAAAASQVADMQAEYARESEHADELNRQYRLKYLAERAQDPAISQADRDQAAGCLARINAVRASKALSEKELVAIAEDPKSSEASRKAATERLAELKVEQDDAAAETGWQTARAALQATIAADSTSAGDRWVAQKGLVALQAEQDARASEKWQKRGPPAPECPR